MHLHFPKSAQVTPEMKCLSFIPPKKDKNIKMKSGRKKIEIFLTIFAQICQKSETLAKNKGTISVHI